MRKKHKMMARKVGLLALLLILFGACSLSQSQTPAEEEQAVEEQAATQEEAPQAANQAQPANRPEVAPVTGTGRTYFVDGERLRRQQRRGGCALANAAVCGQSNRPRRHDPGAKRRLCRPAHRAVGHG